MNAWAFSEALESLIATIRDGQKQRRAPTAGVSIPVDDEQAVAFTDRGVEIAQKQARLIALCADMIATAQPMFWSRLPTNLVREVAKQIDPETPMAPDLLYCPEAWCWFEDPILVPPTQAQGMTIRQTALSWTWGTHEGKEGLGVVGWVQGFGGIRNIPLWVAFAETGQPLSALAHNYGETDDGIDLGLLQFAVAAGAFLRTKLAATDMRAPDRHARRRLERDAWTGASLIEIVMLRHKESHRDHAERFVEWQHQWIVRAHTRQQWYASKQKHLPIIVAPYLKGPEDKPLKTPSKMIFAVTR